MPSPLWCFAFKAPIAAPLGTNPAAIAPPNLHRFAPTNGGASLAHEPRASAPFYIRQVSQDLFCGPRPNAAMMHQLKALGIKTIVNLEDYHTYWGWFGWRMRTLADSANINVIRQPISPLFRVSQHRVDTIVALLRDSAQGPFYVHCLLGKERTNLVVALHRRINQSMPKRLVHRAMLDDGFRARLVPLLASQVETLLKGALELPHRPAPSALSRAPFQVMAESSRASPRAGVSGAAR